jgi:hypothetical protein
MRIGKNEYDGRAERFATAVCQCNMPMPAAVAVSSSPLYASSENSNVAPRYWRVCKMPRQCSSLFMATTTQALYVDLLAHGVYEYDAVNAALSPPCAVWEGARRWSWTDVRRSRSGQAQTPGPAGGVGGH